MMQVYKNTQSIEKPKDFEINPYKVFVTKNVTEIEVEGATSYKYDLYEYTPEEYIGILEEDKGHLNEQLLDTQMALCDIYELIGG